MVFPDLAVISKDNDTRKTRGAFQTGREYLVPGTGYATKRFFVVRVFKKHKRVGARGTIMGHHSNQDPFPYTKTYVLQYFS